jgi:cyanophycinase
MLLPCGRLVATLPAGAVVKQPAAEIPGTLVIVGGGKVPDAVRDQFVALSGGSKARLVVIPTASASADLPDAAQVLEPWKAKGPASVILLHTRRRDQANDPTFLQPLKKATGVWLTGGDQARLAAAYHGTAVEKELHNLLRRGGVIGGTSAGAAVMSAVMITGGNPRAEVGEGFGFLTHVVIDQHFLKRNRMDRLVGVLASHPGLVGLGIDEQTAVIVHGRTLTVAGNSYAVACLSAGAGQPAHFQVLKAGDKADLISLSRAALARAQPPHPAATPPVPVVPPVLCHSPNCDVCY